MNCDVIIACDGRHAFLLGMEFNNLRFVNLPGYRIQFGSNKWRTVWKIFLQIPKIIIAVKRERQWLASFLHENKVHAVISDNRYGLTNSTIPCAFITHQLSIKTPFGDFLNKRLQRINYRYVNRFNECWLPDYPGKENLGGELSHPAFLPAVTTKYLGRLTRFSRVATAGDDAPLLIILSGPEPQRSVFEDMVLNQLRHYRKPAVLVRGLPDTTQALSFINGYITIYNHLATDALNKKINEAGIILSRSGYSTVMDLIGRNKKCIFVPTPGQTEQEYLAEYLSSKRFCISFLQHRFHLEESIRQARALVLNPFTEPVNVSYQQVVADFVKTVSLPAEVHPADA